MVTKIKRFFYTLPFIAVCATPQIKIPNKLEFVVQTTSSNETTTTVNGETLTGTTYKFGPACEGEDFLVQRESGQEKYGVLVRVRNCIKETRQQRSDYRDFTRTSDLERGPYKVEIMLPDNTCIVKTFEYKNGKRQESPWTKVDCSTLEKLEIKSSK